MATQMELEVFGAKSEGHLREKTTAQQQDRVFFRLSLKRSRLAPGLNVYTDVDNTERARVRDKKTKETNFVGKPT